MKRLCAWCRKELDDSSADVVEEREITHGICEDCLSNIEFQDGVKLSRFLDSLKLPVIVCDRKDHVQSLNAAAAAALGIDRGEFVGNTPGLVFECEYARFPEGCGRTVHCSGCAIRMAIQRTGETGQTVFRQPATLTKNDREISLLITTEKLGDLVLLRLDEIAPAAGGEA